MFFGISKLSKFKKLIPSKCTLFLVAHLPTTNLKLSRVQCYFPIHVLVSQLCYTLSQTWSGMNLAVLMAAQGAFGTDFYDRSIRAIVGTMLWTEYRPVIKIGPKGALRSHEIRPIHSAPSLGQSRYCPTQCQYSKLMKKLPSFTTSLGVLLYKVPS